MSWQEISRKSNGLRGSYVWFTKKPRPRAQLHNTHYPTFMEVCFGWLSAYDLWCKHCEVTDGTSDRKRSDLGTPDRKWRINQIRYFPCGLSWTYSPIIATDMGNMCGGRRDGDQERLPGTRIHLSGRSSIYTETDESVSDEYLIFGTLYSPGWETLIGHLLRIIIIIMSLFLLSWRYYVYRLSQIILVFGFYYRYL